MPSTMSSSSVVQHALRWVVQVVELAAAYRLHEQEREDRAEQKGDRQEKEDRVHVRSLLIDTSMREEPQITIALEAGMRIAATRGLIKPAAAALTATML